jgi:hypothetical protein
MDIEGVLPNVLELSIFVYHDHTIQAIFHDYAAPTKKEDLDEINRQAAHCHCMSPSVIRQTTSNTPSLLLQKGKEFASQYPTAFVLSNDEKSTKSDVKDVISLWELDLHYENVFLGHWKYRPHHPSHLLARQAKRSTLRLGALYCDVRRMHPLRHFVSGRKRSDGTRHYSAGDFVKKAHGAHCSYYDTYELFLFLENNALFGQ